MKIILTIVVHSYQYLCNLIIFHIHVLGAYFYENIDLEKKYKLCKIFLTLCSSSVQLQIILAKLYFCKMWEWPFTDLILIFFCENIILFKFFVTAPMMKWDRKFCKNKILLNKFFKII